MKIKKGDTVILMKGKDKGKHGKIIQSFPGEGVAVVEGLNVRVKHLRARGSTAGQCIEYPSPVAVANMMLLCPSCGKKTRVGFHVSADGVKQRMCKKCQATFA